MIYVLPLLKFMKERHQIYLNSKVLGFKKPWTRDPILQQYRFCNVYRELDTVTQWIDRNIRRPYADHPNLWFMLCIARRINWPDTLSELMLTKGWPHRLYHPEALMNALDHRTAMGRQVYTGAYMITAETGAEHIGQTKSRTTAYSNLGRLWDQRKEVEPLLHDTLEGAYKAILGRGFAWGPFMTYEVVTDLRHTRYLQYASDKMRWANAGPGALRGLNRVWNLDPKTPMKEEDALKKMQTLLMWFQNKWPKGDVNPHWPRLEMREIEHSLCEFDKYERVRLGQGRPRSMYPGRGDQK